MGDISKGVKYQTPFIPLKKYRKKLLDKETVLGGK
jgi:hypothetical protein